MKDYYKTDPEFMERFAHFAFEEVVNEEGQTLDEVTRHTAILAALLGCQGIDEFRLELPRALDAGVTPVMAKEVIYQAVDYLGIGRVLPFLDAANEILTARGVSLPLEGQAATTMEDRLEKGAAAQAEIFGEAMKEAWKAGHINRWLAANCCCEPQLTSHAKGNMNLGNDKDFLIWVTSQCLPYIGYPRSLNAISCVNQAASEG